VSVLMGLYYHNTEAVNLLSFWGSETDSIFFAHSHGEGGGDHILDAGIADICRCQRPSTLSGLFLSQLTDPIVWATSFHMIQFQADSQTISHSPTKITTNVLLLPMFFQYLGSYISNIWQKYFGVFVANRKDRRVGVKNIKRKSKRDIL